MFSTYNGIVFGVKREWNFDTCYNMINLENIMLSEISQTAKDKYIACFHLQKISRAGKFIETESKIKVT